MWPTWSTGPSENARRQRLSMSVTSGRVVVQQEDPDHIAASGLARACRRRQTLAGCCETESDTNSEKRAVHEKAEFSITVGSDVQIDQDSCAHADWFLNRIVRQKQP